MGTFLVDEADRCGSHLSSFLFDASWLTGALDRKYPFRSILGSVRLRDSSFRKGVVDINVLRASPARESRNLEKHSVHTPADLKAAPGLRAKGRRLIANVVVLN